MDARQLAELWWPEVDLDRPASQIAWQLMAHVASAAAVVRMHYPDAPPLWFADPHGDGRWVARSK